MTKTLRQRAITLTESKIFETAVIGMIIVNSIVLGLETFTSIYDKYRQIFVILDVSFLTFFVSEILIRIYARRWRFFAGGWNWFDFLIVVVSLLPFLGNLSALRALRILRALRLLHAIPEFRDITESLLRAATGALAVFGMLGLLLYVFGVMSSKLFGEAHPDLFGNLGTSLITHLALMAFDGWRETVTTVEATHGYWVVGYFFVIYTAPVGLVGLSLLVGLIVEARQTVSNEELREEIRRLQV